MATENSTFNSTCIHGNCWIKSPISQTFYVIALFGGLVVFLPLNVWVLQIGIKQTLSIGRLPPSDILTLNQAAMELCNCFSLFLNLLTNIICGEAFSGFVLYINSFCFCGRTYFSSTVCLERYLAVVHPVKYLHERFNIHRKMYACLNWLIPLICGALEITSSSFMSLYRISFDMSIVVMILCNLAMLRVLLKPKPGGRNNRSRDQKKMKAFRVIAAILLFTLFGYIPFLTAPVFIAEHYCEFLTAATWFFIPNFMLPPLLYLSKFGKIQWLTCF